MRQDKHHHIDLLVQSAAFYIHLSLVMSFINSSSTLLSLTFLFPVGKLSFFTFLKDKSMDKKRGYTAAAPL
jgi:hypothetical protein